MREATPQAQTAVPEPARAQRGAGVLDWLGALIGLAGDAAQPAGSAPTHAIRDTAPAARR